jgi:hypothetical protein
MKSGKRFVDPFVDQAFRYFNYRRIGLPSGEWFNELYEEPRQQDAHVRFYWARQADLLLESGTSFECEINGISGAIDPSDPSKWRGNILVTLKIHHPKDARLNVRYFGDGESGATEWR